MGNTVQVTGFSNKPHNTFQLYNKIDRAWWGIIIVLFAIGALAGVVFAAFSITGSFIPLIYPLYAESVPPTIADTIFALLFTILCGLTFVLLLLRKKSARVWGSASILVYFAWICMTFFRAVSWTLVPVFSFEVESILMGIPGGVGPRYVENNLLLIVTAHFLFNVVLTWVLMFSYNAFFIRKRGTQSGLPY